PRPHRPRIEGASGHAAAHARRDVPSGALVLGETGPAGPPRLRAVKPAGGTLLDMVLGQFVDEARRDVRLPLVEQPAIGGEEHIGAAARACQPDVSEAPLLFQSGGARLI